MLPNFSAVRAMIAMTTAVAILMHVAIGMGAETILVEAEQFDDLGGWVNDCQFMDQMGSPFLLAHGLGRPVEDATTEIELPGAGIYRVWVRTRDWVATWKAAGSPGRFQLEIDGKPLAATFGTEGAAWHWQDGGTVELDGNRAKLALHDLTGFEGRCDVILLTTDLDFTPPDADLALARWRCELLGLSEEPIHEKPIDTGSIDTDRFDLVVTGGGISGTCAALAAARLGLSVALVQDRPVLGGNNSSEIRVWLQGARNKEPYPRVGDIVLELEQPRHAHYGPSNTADLYQDDKKIAIVRDEENLSLFLNHRVNAVEMDGDRIDAVVAQNTTTGQRRRFTGRWFADTTGDGCIGYLAGADHEITLQGHLGRCNLWNVADTGEPVAFPRCPWALDLTEKPFPGRDRGGIESLGGWYWESGFYLDPITQGESIRDWNFRAAYGAWDALKNVDGKYPDHKLNWVAHVSGKRESRRLLGDVVLSKEDVLDGKEFPDGCVPTGWSIDLHLPDPRYEKGFEGNAFIAKAHFTHYPTPYWIPYRCLYSRNVPNLFMAGRDISVTHEALGTVRVMRTGGCMGEIVGMAASVCKQHDVDPRDVYTHHLDNLKQRMQKGTGRPPRESRLQPPKWLDAAGDNLALEARIAVSSSKDEAEYPPKRLNDGLIDLNDNTGRWLSGAGGPHWIELRWERSRTISAARVISGYTQASGHITAPIHAFVLQIPDGPATNGPTTDGSGWQDLPETRVVDNTAIDWHARFEPVTTACVRLHIEKTDLDLDISRIWEVEFYELESIAEIAPQANESSGR